MGRMDTVLSLILLVSEMLKYPWAKVEAHFLMKLAFVNNKCLFTRCLRKMSKDNRKLFKIHSSTQIVMYTNFLIILHILQIYSSK